MRNPLRSRSHNLVYLNKLHLVLLVQTPFPPEYYGALVERKTDGEREDLRQGHRLWACACLEAAWAITMDTATFLFVR